MNRPEQPAITILGIDPSLRSLGYAVLKAHTATRCELLAQGVIKTPPTLEHGPALLLLHDELENIILTHRPDAAAVEKTIYVQSPSIAITLGVARGAVLLVLARHGIPAHDYPPKSVKAAATGRGGAGKNAVALMVRAQLGMNTTPQPDAADAIATALAHAKKHFFQQRLPG